MGQLIRIPEKPPHTFLFNCFSKLPSPHHLASSQTKSNKQQGRVQSLQPSEKSKGKNKEASLCLASEKFCFSQSQNFFFFHFQIAFKGNLPQFIELEQAQGKPLGSCSPIPFGSCIYISFFCHLPRVVLSMGYPTK